MLKKFINGPFFFGKNVTFIAKKHSVFFNPYINLLCIIFEWLKIMMMKIMFLLGREGQKNSEDTDTDVGGKIHSHFIL